MKVKVFKEQGKRKDDGKREILLKIIKKMCFREK